MHALYPHVHSLLYRRAQYNTVINTLKLNVHFTWQYQLVGAALQRTVEVCLLSSSIGCVLLTTESIWLYTKDPVFVVRIDRRKSFSELKSAILEVCSITCVLINRVNN